MESVRFSNGTCQDEITGLVRLGKTMSGQWDRERLPLGVAPAQVQVDMQSHFQKAVEPEHGLYRLSKSCTEVL